MLNASLNASHAVDLPGLQSDTSGNTVGTRFGRLMKASTDPVDRPVLKALAATMVETFEAPADRGKSGLFAGYTYLGQFIDHDITHDRNRFDQLTSPTRSVTTSALDLDSVYGEGPDVDVALYQGRGSPRLSVARNDLLRGTDGKSNLREQRNDSNQIISQLHVAFIRFHNRAVAELADRNVPSQHLFAEARRATTCHYQWLVVDDFLRTLVGRNVVSRYLDAARSPGGLAEISAFDPKDMTFMPTEFSGAAFRFGHSMVRRGYQMNRDGGSLIVFDGQRLTGTVANDLRGFRPLQAERGIDWSLYFHLPGAPVGDVQLARPINPLITEPMCRLPFVVTADDAADGRSVPFRNLMRGQVALNLPSGQEVAEFFGIPSGQVLGRGMEFDFSSMTTMGLDLGDLDGSGVSLDALKQAVSRRTPLWYYILVEAWTFHAGEQLGPLGSRIVTEVLFALLLNDTDSFLHRDGWKPTAGECGCTADGVYQMVDFLRFANNGSLDSRQ